jgi:chromosome segregation ATPase
MEKSAELLSTALTAELASLKEQIGSMAEQFSEKFNGASLELASSMQGFQPTIEILTATVGNAQQTVFDAVTKLNSHEKVMQEMASAALHIQEAAVTFGSMNETLKISAERNENAANAQLQVARSNQAVVDQFEKINAGLSDMQQTIDAAARVIGSLGSPIADLQTLLASQPELQKELENTRATSESERSQLLLNMASNLAEKVGIAAQQFSEVSILADKLTTSAESLQEASQGLAIFGQNIMDASKDQRDASEASRAAAYSGEKVAKAMESIPNSIANLTHGLESAGSSVRDGALAAKGSYEELNVFQKQWFAGVELGLNAMKDQLQSLIQSYGDQVEGQTRNLMKQWTDEVTSSLQSYTTQVEVLQGGLDELQGAINKFRK